MRAQTTARSASEASPIQRLRPSSTQSPPTRRAVVRIDPGSLPASGSVSAKHPIASPAAIAGSQRCFWASEPHAWIAVIASDPCTDANVRNPVSPASSSRHARPYCTALPPGHP